jgi:phytoene dehydrogenase-like protein
MSVKTYDAVVVGSGPNGLAAAITLARAGASVVVYEAEATVGGGTRSGELTLPGFIHDVCSAVHPLGIVSPFFRSVPLAEHGVEWIHSPAPLAHPFDDGTAAMLERSIEATGATLGPDGRAYHDLMAPLVAGSEALLPALLAPLFPPKRPFRMAWFGRLGMRSARKLAISRFQGERARALFVGLAAHAIRPLEEPFTASFALTLAMFAHLAGWPVARGGSQKIADALASYFRSLGGSIELDRPVASVDDLPVARATLFDLTPLQIIKLAGGRLPHRFRRKLEGYRYGPAAFKIDWALDGHIPWKAPECARAATVHLGGTLEQISSGESAVERGEHPDHPFVLLAQPSLFDSSRAPPGKHTAWAYCHVPNGSTTDMTAQIEAQVERFAPGFRKRILKRHVMSPAGLERYNANYVGGDMVGGSNNWRQIIARPTMVRPYSIPVKGWYLCSASTPPGGGVHGMCGYNAALAALSDVPHR